MTRERKRDFALLLAATFFYFTGPMAVAPLVTGFAGSLGAGEALMGLAGGLMNGVSAEYFDPDATLTRSMMVTLLWRLAGEPVVNYLMPFDDVDQGSWYGEAVRWAASEGIVSGVSGDSYAPNDPITREQLAVILYRFAVYMGYDVSVGEDTNILSYEDFAEISEYAIPAIQWATGSGLMRGVTDGELSPQGTATRAQIATLMMRFIESI